MTSKLASHNKTKIFSIIFQPFSHLHCGSQYMFNPLYASKLFHCYMLDKSICHFRDVKSILLLFKFYSIFDGKSC